MADAMISTAAVGRSSRGDAVTMVLFGLSDDIVLQKPPHGILERLVLYKYKTKDLFGYHLFALSIHDFFDHRVSIIDDPREQLYLSIRDGQGHSGVHSRPLVIKALARTSSLRIIAVMTSLAGFPCAIREQALDWRSRLNRMATSAGM